MDKNVGNKLKKAQQLKEHLRDEKLIHKYTDGMDYFKRHWSFREENRETNIKLYQMHENEKRANMEVVFFTFLFKFSIFFKQSCDCKILLKYEKIEADPANRANSRKA